jgi:hypothetical protein
MHPEDRSVWEQGPAPEWNREAVWERIAQQRRPASRRRRWVIAASVLVLVLAGGAGVSVLFAPPDEILPMMKDRELDTELLPTEDSLSMPGEPVSQPVPQE